MDFATASEGSEYQFLALQGLSLTDGFASVVAAGMALGLTLLLVPPLLRKMHAGGMIGHDVNKRSKDPVAELGGIAALFAFSVALTTVVGLQKLLGNVAEPPFLAAISVFFMASMIGLIDDISDLRQRLKAVAISFAALPLMLVHIGPEVIDLPFGLEFTFTGEGYLIYWIILVPLGVTGVANAMNMSAGYNGLESGQIVIVSFALILIGTIRGVPEYALLILSALFGCALGLYHFNRYPARIFIGDIGTLGMGAALAAGAVLGHMEFYGAVAIAPAFYEAGATLYYGFRGMNGDRKVACQNPVITPDGTLRAPERARRFTLAYLLLSIRPATEKSLVRRLLALYAVSAGVAVVLSVL